MVSFWVFRSYGFSCLSTACPLPIVVASHTVYNDIYIYIAVLQVGRSLVRIQLVSLEFFIDIKSFRSHYGPGVDSAPNRNEYQERFLGVKAARA